MHLSLQEIARKAPGPLAGAALLIFLSAVWPGWPKLGQLAWANENDRVVDSKVAKAVSPIQTQVNAIAESVRLQGEDTQEVIVALIASEIRAAVAARCMAPPGARERENKAIEELQRKYMKRMNRQYDAPNCNEL